MKNLKITVFLLFFAALLFNGCNDDFLTRTPLDEISSETFWNTEADLRVYNNSLYDLARDDIDVPILMAHHSGFGSHYASIWFQDEFADNMAPRHSRHTRYQQVRAGKHNVPSGVEWFGYRGWDFVRAINVGLDNYENADVSQDVINKYAGEARLFRGWFYADKVQRFGDAPWVDKPLNIDSEELYAPRTPREEVMNNVLADLTFATEHLPADWGDGNAPGRLNRWAALLVKSRVALFEGTWRKFHGGSNADMWLQEAADAAKELMDDGPYSLYNTGDPENDYNAYHRVLDLTGNPEVIYWRKYTLGVFTNHVQSYFSYTGGATKSMVESYLCTDGLPITESGTSCGSDDEIEDVFVDRDPRLRQTILHPEDSGKYRYHVEDGRDYPRITGMSGGRISTTGYHIIKHYNADDLIGKAYNTAESPGIILRFGEALLNYAEAVYELNGSITDQQLNESINLLRDRVGMPHLTNAFVTVNGLDMQEEIRRERRVELFMEGHRYNDIRRWAQGELLEEPDLGIRWNAAAEARYEGATIQTAVDPSNGFEYIDVYAGTDWADPVFEDKHYLWPIPTSVTSQNEDISQNPGW